MAQKDPKQLGNDDLVLSHFSLGRLHPIEDRVRLAAANGFAGLGLWFEHYRQLEEQGFAPGGLRDLLAEHDLCIAEIEVVSGLGRDGPGGERAAATEDVAWRMADEFGCRYMQVIGPAGPDLDAAAAAFGALCDRAGDHGLEIGIEFLPFTDIVSVHDARRIVEAADRPNGGICVDIWHHERGARDLAGIAALPPEMILCIQMNDGTRRPENDDYYTDCLANRRAPGDGEFDVRGFVDALRSAGARVPWSVEVCSTDGWADPDAHVERIASAMRSYL